MSRVYEKDQNKIIKEMINKNVVKFEKKQHSKENINKTSNPDDVIVLSKDAYILSLENMVNRLVSICDAQTQLINTYEESRTALYFFCLQDYIPYLLWKYFL